MKRILLLTLLACGLSMAMAQQFKHTVPYSQREDFQRSKPDSSDAIAIPHIIKDDVDTEEELAFLESEECIDCGGEVGVFEEVDIDFFREAKRSKLKDGGELFQLEIKLNTAHGAEFVFDQIKLSERAELYIIDENGNSVGAITKKQINGDSYTSFPADGSEFILELYDPYGESDDMDIHINEVVYYFEPFAKSNIQVDGENSNYYNLFLSCLDREALSSASAYSEIKDAIGMMAKEFPVSNTGKRYRGYCSGALINNTQNDGTPYFLTARHCFYGRFTDNSGLFESLDPIADLKVDNSFVFNYELGESDLFYTNGAQILSVGNESDYLLMRLETNPKNYTDAYYLGWDRTTDESVLSSVVGIHHPGGTEKHISFSSSPVTIENPEFELNEGVFNQDFRTTNGSFWVMRWDESGTATGSSGSPLLANNSDKIIGTLCCGNYACNTGVHNKAQYSPQSDDLYGIFGRSWDSPSPVYYDANKQLKSLPALKTYLDPGKSDVQDIGGFDSPEPVLDDIEVSIVTPSITGLYSQEWIASEVFLNGNRVPEHKLSYSWKLISPAGETVYETGRPDFSYGYIEAGNYRVELTVSIISSGHEIAQVHSRIVKVLEDVIEDNDRLTFLIEPSTLYTNELEVVTFKISKAKIGAMPINPRDLEVTWDLGATGVEDFVIYDEVEAYFTSVGYPHIQASASINIGGKNFNHTQEFSSLRVSDGNPGELDLVVDVVEGTWFPEKDEPITFTQEVYLEGQEISDWTELDLTWDFGASASPATATGLGPHTVQYSTAGEKSVSVSANVVYEEYDFKGAQSERFTVSGVSNEEIDMTIKGCPGNLTPTVDNAPSEYYDLSVETDFNFNHVPQANYKWYNGETEIGTGTFPGRLSGASDIKVELYSGYGSNATLVKTVEKENCGYYGPFQHVAEILSIIQYGRCLDDDPEIVVKTFSTHNNNDMAIWMSTLDGRSRQVFYKSKETEQLSHNEYYNEFRIDLKNYIKSIRGQVMFRFLEFKNSQVVETFDTKYSEINAYQFENVRTISQIQGVCVGQEISVLKKGQSPNYSYSWRGNAVSLALLDDIHKPNPQFVGAASGGYNYIMEVRDPESGCTREVNVNVVVQDLDVENKLFKLCNEVNNEVELNVAGGSGSYSVEWLPNAHIMGVSSTRLNNKVISNVTPIANTLVNIDQTIRVSDNQGCSRDFDLRLTSSNPFVSDLPDYLASECGEIVEVDAGSGGSSYTWTDIETGNTVGIDRKFTTEIPLDLRLTVNNGHGCTSSHNIYVDAYRIALGLNPGGLLYKKSHNNGVNRKLEIGDYNGDGINDYAMFNGSAFYAYCLDELGNVKASYEMFDINQVTVGGTKNLSDYVNKSFSTVGDVDGNGVNEIAFRMSRKHLRKDQFDCALFGEEIEEFKFNNQRVWIIYPKSKEEGGGAKASRLIGDSRASNHIRVGMFKQYTHFALQMTCPYSNEDSYDKFGLPIDKVGCLGLSPFKNDQDWNHAYRVHQIVNTPGLNPLSDAVFWNQSEQMERWKIALSRKIDGQYMYGGLNLTSDATASWNSDLFGFSICGESDINGDGVNDLIIAAPRHDEQGGENYTSPYGLGYLERMGCHQMNTYPDDKNFGGLYVILLNSQGMAIDQHIVDANSFNFIDGQIVNDESALPDVSLKQELGWDFVHYLGDLNGDGQQEYLVTTKKKNGSKAQDANRTYWLITLNRSGRLVRQREIRTSEQFITGNFVTSTSVQYPRGIVSDKYAYTNIFSLGDLTGDGVKEFGITNSRKIWVLKVDYSGNLFKLNTITSDAIGGSLFSNVTSPGDLNQDGVRDIMTSSHIIFLDGVPKEGFEAIKKEIRWCGNYMGYDNRIKPMRADRILVGTEYCDEYDYSQYEAPGTNVFSVKQQNDQRTPYHHNTPIFGISCGHAPFLAGKNDIHLRATKEIVFGPGTSFSPGLDCGDGQFKHVHFDVSAKIFDPADLEKCTGDRARRTAYGEYIGLGEDDADSFDNELTSSQLAEDGEIRLDVFPSPSTGLFTIKSPDSGESHDVTLINSFGQVVWDGVITADRLEIDASQFPSGVYIVRTRGVNGIASGKVIVEK